MLTKYKEICVICGAPKEEIHHLIFGRGMRPLADADELTAPMCKSCHKAIHYSGTAAALSKMVGQLQWEKDFLLSVVNDEMKTELEDHARDVFRKRYGRSWL